MRHRFLIASCIVVAGLAAVTVASGFAQTPAASPLAPPAEVPLLPADAKALLGDWTVAAEGPQGPTTMLLTLKVEEDKVVGEISSTNMGKNPIPSVTKYGDDVVLRYSFDYQGSMISTVVTLTPDGEALKASFDFADGAFVMPGTATRKKP